MCVTRTAQGLKALVYSMLSRCRKTDLMDWSLRSHLYVSLVRSSLLYGVQAWGPGVSVTESGFLPVEAEALILTIMYIMHVRTLPEDRLPAITTRYLVKGQAWFADIIRWWGLPEEEWTDNVELCRL
ncbi:hypothetical protein R1flu_020013 [Riccia fluitans]|uniref:Uncharacterized protein n=1 Tax=Riccia fluitans TaxID=41844 RepID=A0ABD1ZKA4_9MARC